MKYNKYETSTGRNIHVFREVYDYTHQVNLLKWSLRQQYRFNPGNDSLLLTSKAEMVLSCGRMPATDEFKEMMRFDEIDGLNDIIGDRKIDRHWINCDISKGSSHFHPDAFEKGSLSLLYYLNCEWDLSWDGYTVWASDDLKDIEHIESLEPGKMVLFDSLIPHKPTAVSSTAPSFRYTMNTVWK